MLKRNEMIDMQKGLLAMLVVLGHCILFGSIDEQLFIENNSLLLRIIYSYHMPLFMMICGFYTAASYNKYGIKTIVNRIVQLWPVFLFALFFSLIELIRGKSILLFLKGLLFRFLTNFWFVWAVFYLTIIVCVIYKFLWSNIPLRIITYIGLIALMQFLPNNYNIANYVFMLPYMIFGFEWFTISKYQIKKKHDFSVDRVKIYIILITLSILLLIFYKPYHMIHESGTSLIESKYVMKTQLAINIYRWLVGFIVSGAFFLSVDNIYRKLKSRNLGGEVLIYIGNCSLEIYMIHVYVISMVKYIAQRFQIHYSIIIAFAEFLIVLGITMIVIILLKKIRLFKYVFSKKKMIK